MPYKSLAQAAYMHAAEKRGEIKKSVVDEFDNASRGKMGHLPQKLSHGGEVEGGGVCPACGYAYGGEVEPDEDDGTEPSNMEEVANDPEEERKRYVFALRRMQ